MKEDPKDFREIRDNILIVKGRFKASSPSMFGQFILIFKNNQNFDSYNAVVSTYSDLYNTEPHEDWTKYREFIANVKWRGNFNTTMTSSIMDQFKKFTEEMNSISLLYEHVSDYDYNSMDVTLFDLINRIIHDKTLVLETAIQEVPPSEFRAALDGSGKEEAAPVEAVSGDDGFGVEEDAVILPVKPIVSPVKGKPVYELRISDKLLVFLQPSSDRANYFIDQLNLREEGNDIRPIAAEVIDIKGGSGKNNPTDFLALIAPGIYGKFTETEKQVKLKLYDPLTDGPLSKKGAGAAGQKGVAPAAPGKKGGLTRGTIIMMALFAVILVLFIVLIFLHL
jgi:hypothetical protein